MNCLCCGKALKKDETNGWHKACIKKFFGTAQLPEIVIDDETLERIAMETASKGYTVPGVQKNKGSEQFLPASLKPACRTFRKTYLQILQQNPSEKPTYRIPLIPSSGIACFRS